MTNGAHPTRPPVRIEGNIVSLREKRVEDAQDDYAWRSDPDLAIFDAVPPLKMPWEDFLRLFKDELRYPPPRQLTLSIVNRDDIHIGNCMYYDLDDGRGHAELGIMIGRREYWSQGYGRDAVSTMVRYMFEKPNLNRVYLHTLAWNIRAQKAFHACGFTPLREVLRNGHNFILMEVFREAIVPAQPDPAPQHPSTPAPQHPSTPAPQHPSTPAPQHRSTPVPQHRSTAAPQHPSTAAPQH